ncbi:hypothetical protein OF83DRAFT_580074 [Amylostereum chailletii]|nr:hypothetical protein OF83DRAFT_580074 [Amylostereum chailletii]
MKRKADSLSSREGSAKKARVEVKTEEEPEVIHDARCSSYATERLGCLPCVTHAIEFLIQDDLLWLFWFDRQGTIQTTGINFIQDLPRFMVLLLALSRLDRSDWGIPAEFPDGIDVPVQDSILDFPASQIQNDSIVEDSGTSDKSTTSDDSTVDHAPANNEATGEDPTLEGSSTAQDTYTAEQHIIKVNWVDYLYCAPPTSGRATRVYGASEDGRKEGLILKIAYPDQSRVAEQEIVHRARTANVDSTFLIKMHLPNLICAMDMWDSGDVREAVGLMASDADRKKRRVLRVTVYDRLTPLHHLRGKDFRRCWFQIVHCDYLLWKKGICHNDPSLGNFAVRIVDGVHYGVLNDWDLATIVGLPSDEGVERTGTPPFMAVDLCHRNFWEGKIVRLYRHELEGKIWVLVWTHLQYDDDNEFQSHRVLVQWTGDLFTARNSKGAMHNDLYEFVPLAPWKSEWPLTRRLCWMLHDAEYARVCIRNGHWEKPHIYSKMQGEIQGVELSMEQVYVQFWIAVKEFYGKQGDLEGYRELREALHLPVDVDQSECSSRLTPKEGRTVGSDSDVLVRE